MKKLLRIDCSPRINGSHSREITDYFEHLWKNSYPDGKVIYRDLVKNQIPHISDETIKGFYTPKNKLTPKESKAIVLSDMLVTELKNADEIIISSPLYNFGTASNLKAYLDHIVRVGHTFKVNEDGSYSGLLKTKATHLVTAKGGSYKGTSMEKNDFQVPHIQAVFNTLGIDNINLLSLEGTSNKHTLVKNEKLIKEQISEYFKTNNYEY